VLGAAEVRGIANPDEPVGKWTVTVGHLAGKSDLVPGSFPDR